MHANRMSKDELVSKLATTWRNENALMAETIALLIQIEEKRVHLELASPSMFEFCMRHFGMSEGEAYRRTAVARVAGKFPAILAALREKRVHLTTLAKMRKLFTRENVEELLTAVEGKRKWEVDEVIARYAPRPDVPSRVRKLPARRATRSESTATLPVSSPAPIPVAASSSSASPTTSPHRTPASERTLDFFASPPRPATVTPLAESRYAVQFTAGAELRAVIEEVKSLMAHRQPDGDLAAIAMVAFSDLAAKLKKEKLAALSKAQSRNESTPQKSANGASDNKRRRIPNAVRREVIARDGLQCTYQAPNGARCPARNLLELDHRHPHALGGGNDAGNLRLLCRAHNQYAAEVVFGRDHMVRAVEQRKRQEYPKSCRTEADRRAVRYEPHVPTWK